jgi:hypothetical protein
MEQKLLNKKDLQIDTSFGYSERILSSLRSSLVKILQAWLQYWNSRTQEMDRDCGVAKNLSALRDEKQKMIVNVTPLFVRLTS